MDRPQAATLGRSRLGSFGLVGTHATILLVAIPIARQFTAKATGLPPQDFDFTVGVVAFELYPALWILVCALAAMVFSVGMFLLSASSSVIATPMLNHVYVAVVRIVIGRRGEPTQAIEQRRKRFAWRTALHAIGAMLIAFGAATVWSWHARLLDAHPDLIR